MQPTENKVNAVIQGSSTVRAVASSEGITMSDVIGLIKNGENPNNSIPFMGMNRATRRAVLQQAKRLSKKF